MLLFFCVKSSRAGKSRPAGLKLKTQNRWDLWFINRNAQNPTSRGYVCHARFPTPPTYTQLQAKVGQAEKQSKNASQNRNTQEPNIQHQRLEPSPEDCVKVQKCPPAQARYHRGGSLLPGTILVSACVLLHRSGCP